MIGQTISHYRIIEKLGSGGMGVVYKAEDVRLGRYVALKFLNEGFAKDRAALERFKREARAASSINHPHICTIYDIGEYEGAPFIAMELLEGQALNDLIKERPLPVEDLLEYCVQVTQALDAAHTRGILHRDVKPANVFITSGQHAKLLDFGLAKLLPSQAELAATVVNTRLEPTIPGTPVGTISYMSPEQARGETLDPRSDLFSLAVVIYEMATAQRPFEGTSIAAIFEAILNRTPAPVSSINAEIPIELERILSKALEKDRENRYQSAKDLLVDLRRLRRDTQSVSAVAGVPKAPSFGGRRIGIVALIVGIMVAVRIALYFLSPLTPLPGNPTFTQITTQPGEELFPSLSPDGKNIVYASNIAANWDIYLQRVGGQNPVNLTQGSFADDTEPAFSPDGNYIAFRSERQGGGIFVMGATGESVKRLTDSGYNPAWSPSGGEVVYATERIVDNPNNRTSTSQIWTVNVNSGQKRLISKGDAVQPSWSPDGYRIAYWAQEGGRRDIWTMTADGSAPVRVTDDPHLDWNPVWSPDAKYLYFCSDRGGTTNIWRIRLDSRSGRVLGEPETVTTGGAGAREHFSFSKDGKSLVYVEALNRLNLRKIRFDGSGEIATGEPIAITQGTRWDTLPNVSPDGEWVAFSSADKQEDIYVVRNDGTELRQLTNDPFKDRLPRWSPDGTQIAFYSNRNGGYAIWTIHPDGSGLQKRTEEGTVAPFPVWSPDGAKLAYRDSETGWTIDPPREPLPRLSDSESFQPWSWSADGRRIAGERVANGSGAPRGLAIYDLQSRRFENLLDAGVAPVWLKDNRRLLYWSQDKIHVIDSLTKKNHEVLNATPDAIDVTFALSRDDSVIYFTLVSRAADIWLMSLK
jgi:Tol biopolymer transport system component/predicted Ser/Thr protein kinase